MSAKVPRKFPRRKAARVWIAISASPFRATRTTRNIKFPGRPEETIGTDGTMTAITASKAHKAGSTLILTTRARRIWMRTANGRMSPTTATCGFPQRAPVGLLIGMAVGCMNPTTAGPGFLMSPGDGRRITTDAGSSMAGTGAGGRAQYMRGISLCGRRHTFHSSVSAEEDGESALDSDLAAASAVWVGFRSARVIASIHGTGAASTA